MQVRFWLFGFIKHPADEESQQIRQGERNTLTSVFVYCMCVYGGAALMQKGEMLQPCDSKLHQNLNVCTNRYSGF